MKVKNFATCVWLVTAGLAGESAFAGSQAREQVCLVIGKYAQAAADAQQIGTSEKESMGLLTPGRKGTPQGDLYVALQQVVTWVYTVRLPPAEARKLVYTKCLNREFFAYNPKLDG